MQNLPGNSREVLLKILSILQGANSHILPTSHI